MPYAPTKDGVKLYYEEAGHGSPILFCHEFAGDYRNWEPQMRFLSRRHRCITYSARGYSPSDVPKNWKDYSYKHWSSDAIAMLDHLKIDKAHFVGLSMGAYTSLQVALNHPGRARSITLAGIGSGSERWYTQDFRKHSRAIADQYEREGAEAVANTYGVGPSRIPFELKDPRGFAEFKRQLAEHDAAGAGNTSRGFQGARPSLYDFAAEIRKLTVPALIVVGDEDDRCIEPSLFLKATIPASGLVMFPKTGHAVNLEEPDLFNRLLGEFLTRADAGRWRLRDPRTLATQAAPLPWNS